MVLRISYRVLVDEDLIRPGLDMHPILLGFAALVGICSARPAQNELSQRDPSLLNGPSGGFPAEYLPIQVEAPSYAHSGSSSQT